MDTLPPEHFRQEYAVELLKKLTTPDTEEKRTCPKCG